jgi:hypothetical protein
MIRIHRKLNTELIPPDPLQTTRNITGCGCHRKWKKDISSRNGVAPAVEYYTMRIGGLNLVK